MADVLLSSVASQLLTITTSQILGKSDIFNDLAKTQIKIGKDAGVVQATNSIILNASGVELSNNLTNDTSSFFIKPIKNKDSSGKEILLYNTTSGEVTSSAITNLGGTQSSETKIKLGLSAGTTAHATNSIIINASGVELSNNLTNDTSSFFIKPIKNKDSSGKEILLYNTTSGEVTSSAIANLGTQSSETKLKLGLSAGTTNHATNSIIINASGSELNNTIASSLVIAPIRATDVSTFLLTYNDTSKEISKSTIVQVQTILLAALTARVLALELRLIVEPNPAFVKYTFTNFNDTGTNAQPLTLAGTGNSIMVYSNDSVKGYYLLVDGTSTGIVSASAPLITGSVNEIISSEVSGETGSGMTMSFDVKWDTLGDGNLYYTMGIGQGITTYDSWDASSVPSDARGVVLTRGGGSTTDTSMFIMFIDSTGKRGRYHYFGTGGGILSNSWVHIDLIIQPTTLLPILYINGVSIDVGVVNNPTPMSSLVLTSNSLTRTHFAVEGTDTYRVANFRLWKKVLTQAQITEAYTYV